MMQNCSDSFLIALQSSCSRIYPHGIQSLSLNNLTEPKLVFQETFKIASPKPITKEDDDFFMKAINEVDIDSYLNLGAKKVFAETGQEFDHKAMTPKMIEEDSFMPNNQTNSEQQPAQTPMNSVENQVVQENVLPMQLNQQASPKVKGADQKKEDRKNIPGNTLKFALKAYSNRNYLKVIRKIHSHCGITNTNQAIQFLSSKMNWTFGLNDVREELCQAGDENERAYRRAFLIFYKWAMRKVYPIHVINEGKIVIKQEYLRQKNILVYLPDAQKKRPQRRSRNAKKNEETPVNSYDSDEHLIHDLNLLRLSSASNTSHPLFSME